MSIRNRRNWVLSLLLIAVASVGAVTAASASQSGRVQIAENGWSVDQFLQQMKKASPKGVANATVNTKSHIKPHRTAPRQSVKLKDILAEKWSRNDKPARFLPSAVTRCTSKPGKTECWAGEQALKVLNGARQITIRTKSVLKPGKNNTFTLLYRSLIRSSDGSTRWEKNINKASCVIEGKNQIRCTQSGRNPLLFTRAS